MATGIYSWSQTAATNSAADSTIGWAEGQAPSSVNDSARATMAVLAKWRDDISGVTTSNVVLTTAGTATAMTLSTNGSIAALTNGWTVSFLVGAGLSNTGACTLAVDSLTAKNIQLFSGVNLTGGELRTGQVYTVTYHQPSDTWVLHSGPGQGLVKLTQTIASSSSSVDFVLTTYTGFRAIKFMLTGVRPATDGASLDFRLATDVAGTVFDAGASDYSFAYNETYPSTNLVVADNSVDIIRLIDTLDNSTASSTCGEVTVWNQNSTTFNPRVTYHLSGRQNLGIDVVSVGAGTRVAAGDVTGVRFIMDSGNISVGTIAVYGVI